MDSSIHHLIHGEQYSAAIGGGVIVGVVTLYVAAPYVVNATVTAVQAITTYALTHPNLFTNLGDFIGGMAPTPPSNWTQAAGTITAWAFDHRDWLSNLWKTVVKDSKKQGTSQEAGKEETPEWYDYEDCPKE